MPIYIDLFAGCGGLSYGLKQAGWKGLFAIEKNVDAFSTLSTNLTIRKNGHFEWPSWLPKKNNDIYEVLDNHRGELMKLKGKVDLVAGGPPCQGFSMAGRRIEKDARNNLVDAYLDFVKYVEPKMVFFENVHGFTVPFEKGKIPYSIYVKNSLEDLGYIIESKEVDVSELGVPQKRKRFILVGIKNRKPKDFFDNLFIESEKFLARKGLNKTVTIESAIGDLQKENGTYKDKIYKNFDFGLYGDSISNYQKFMRKNVETEKPDSHRFANHKASTIELFQYLQSLSESKLRMTPAQDPTHRLKKRSVTILDPNCICGTITSIPDDYIHYSEPRIMTVREMARIQSFPDSFIFKGKYTTGGDCRKKDVPRYTQIANAVPPLFAEQVGIQLLNLLGE